MILSLLNLAHPSFAGMVKKAAPNSTSQIEGSILSINKQNNEIKIKNDATHEEKSLMVSPKMISVLKEGEHVKIAFNTASNQAESVKVLKEKQHN